MSLTVTIVTACRNNASTIGHTLESVASQCLPEGVRVEHVVVDGASVDNTIAVVNRYADIYSAKGWKLKIESRPDAGPYFAMNTGLDLATGDVVGFLNADDFYTDVNVLNDVVETMSDTAVDAVYGDVHFVRSSAPHGKCVRYYSAGRFRPHHMRMGFMPPHPSFYCRRELYRRYGGFNTDYRIAADFECVLRLMVVHGIKTCYLARDFVTMRTGGLSAGASAHLTTMREAVRACRANGVQTSYLQLALKMGWKACLIMYNRLFNTQK